MSFKSNKICVSRQNRQSFWTDAHKKIIKNEIVTNACDRSKSQVSGHGAASSCCPPSWASLPRETKLRGKQLSNDHQCPGNTETVPSKPKVTGRVGRSRYS
ncbi:hypothetical protein GWI33_017280 [Rhynchophorus ferrugineus]|uniref:Uncharacterized protein n=1 Tax=Rhynchophorus ferrugineus TaxID=354439 RepID=A0A834M2J8_RHYFE|nr:hypothetical protein GWI33_017280 [Rhynchophorus ferrugineus]